ncbi:MAG: copper chaperone PCu(A)C [Pseudomonadota bacterium]
MPVSLSQTFALMFALVLAVWSLGPALADHHGHGEHHDGHHDEHHGEHGELFTERPTDDPYDRHLSDMEGMRALHAWTTATTGHDALIYVELTNTGEEELTIDAVKTGIAESASLVGFQLVDGKETYVPIAQMPIQPGRTMMLEPGALAIELEGLQAPLVEGQEFDVTLVTNLGPLDLHVAIEPAGATAHSHAGHAH